MPVTPFGVEVGILYRLTGPDGTSVSFNDSAQWDFVGFTEEVTGLDGPDTRESADLIVEGDGGYHGNFYHGRRPIVLSGIIDPNTFGSARNTMVSNLLRATNAMRQDAVLSWTPTGGDPVAVAVRRQQPPRVTGGRVKSFQVALVAADPRVYGSTERTLARTSEASPSGWWGHMGDGEYDASAGALSPTLLLPFGSVAGLTNRGSAGASGNGFAVGSPTIGGYSPGPFQRGENFATDLDGTSQWINTTYGTRRNLAPYPNAQATVWDHTFTSVTNSGSGLGNGTWTPGTGNSQYYVKGTATAGTAVACARIGNPSSNRVTVVAGTPYLMSLDINMVQRGAGLFQAIFSFYTSGGSYVSNISQNITGLVDDRVTWRITPPATAERMSVWVGQNGTLASGETIEFSIADFVCEIEPDFVSHNEWELVDSYSGKADGPLTTADTGQAFRLIDNGATNSALRIVSGAVTNTATEASVSAGYAEASLSGNVSTIGGTWSWASGSTTDGAAVFLVHKGPFTLGSLEIPCHLAITRTTWTLDVFVAGVKTQLATGTFSPVLSTATDYTAQVRMSGDVAYVDLPDGTTRVVRDSRISSQAGSYAVQEVYANNASAWSKPSIKSFWADSGVIANTDLPGVGFFPTAAQVDSGRAGWLGTANASASDIGCFANGTTRTFSGWANLDAIYDNQGIFGGSAATGPILFVNAAGNVYFGAQNSGHTAWAGAWPGAAQWVHWVVVFDEQANTAALYINGALISSGAQNTPYAASPGNLQIGTFNSSGAGLALNGKIRSFGVFPRALTAAEIKWLYEEGARAMAFNRGNADTPAVMRITGPITDPVIWNMHWTGGTLFTLTGTISAGNWWEIDTLDGTIVDQAGVNQYGKMVFASSEWKDLKPGVNDLRLVGTGTTGATELKLTWKDAWI